MSESDNSYYEEEKQESQNASKEEYKRLEQWHMELDNYNDGDLLKQPSKFDMGPKDSLMLRLKAPQNLSYEEMAKDRNDSREHDFDGFDDEDN